MNRRAVLQSIGSVVRCGLLGLAVLATARCESAPRQLDAADAAILVRQESSTLVRLTFLGPAGVARTALLQKAPASLTWSGEHNTNPAGLVKLITTGKTESAVELLHRLFPDQTIPWTSPESWDTLARQLCRASAPASETHPYSVDGTPRQLRISRLSEPDYQARWAALTNPDLDPQGGRSPGPPALLGMALAVASALCWLTWALARRRAGGIHRLDRRTEQLVRRGFALAGAECSTPTERRVVEAALQAVIPAREASDFGAGVDVTPLPIAWQEWRQEAVREELAEHARLELLADWGESARHAFSTCPDSLRPPGSGEARATGDTGVEISHWLSALPAQLQELERRSVEQSAALAECERSLHKCEARCRNLEGTVGSAELETAAVGRRSLELEQSLALLRKEAARLQEDLAARDRRLATFEARTAAAVPARELQILDRALREAMTNVLLRRESEELTGILGYLASHSLAMVAVASLDGHPARRAATLGGLKDICAQLAMLPGFKAVERQIAVLEPYLKGYRQEAKQHNVEPEDRLLYQRLLERVNDVYGLRLSSYCFEVDEEGRQLRVG